MAVVLRSLCRQGRHFRNLSGIQSPRIVVVPTLKQVALISTSKKDKGIGATVEPMEKSDELKRLTERFENTDKDNEENWTSYGYEPGDRDSDWFYHHFFMFATVTVGVCWGGFILSYMPDMKFADWCQREAFLELERRERQGLPLVDPNYTNPESIALPSDEDIGEQEIII
ncbi:NADH dehydrogenase [ubiquinone] 1 beta subcomplex subunit 11, mitochondrial [Aplysia californica]|uniref:NADH dehydrogenase [ubiquinone] 1 beta subcomplex subunit 11, mitochondrial n=1 Tax=Aplysia californica TaxID=6500 RepID=A0ABM0K9Z3_APLCA|nr:NADH dehydrogenase [ubiquinone] 1 beta subcomplex subunit 11, mitochondrial [Aplysia californica]